MDKLFTPSPKAFYISNLLWLVGLVSILLNYKCTSSNEGNANCKVFCMDYNTVPFPGLDISAAQIMAYNYAKEHQQMVNGIAQVDTAGRPVLDSTQSKSVWFSLDYIKNFIYQIEKANCQLQCAKIDPRKLGVRFYFAQYPKATDAAAAKPEFSFLSSTAGGAYYGRNTLFMVPTYPDATLGDVDFDPRWSFAKDPKACQPKTMTAITQMKEPYVGPIPMFMALMAAPDPNSMQNHGNICPPQNCDGDSF
jgi:hypothetical protein